ncbi:oligosaccharide flippase family protein [Exiguobacterium sp.]|uniref:oligosaccharide flippase family protein n=1 Tax=Exiguobacterium sp. TaxID=44751 RepID=UPI00263BBA4A|nr:oligosaccharide flippase family protein [Exiguobacterium sp.]MCC5893808.1 oligosaccharide flippase family protein [Exiguobacterium sp.]
MKEENTFFRKLFSNTLLFAIGSFSSRFMIFLLIPIYSRTLTSAEYGFIDLITITVSLLLPFFGLNIHESVIRFTLGKSINKTNVLLFGVQVVLVGFLLMALISPFILNWLNISQFLGYFLTAYLLTGLKNVLMFFARGLEKVKGVVVISILETLFLLATTIILLLVLKMGIDGYFISLIFSNLIALFLYMYLIDIKKFKGVFSLLNWKKNIEMLKYSIPMIPNSMSWWINNTSDKYLLNLFYGPSLTGVYAIAYKVPSLLNTFTSVFMQAWQISAVDEYENSKSKKNFTYVYKALFTFNILICGLLILFSDLISWIMFGSEFIEAKYFVTILLCAYFFNGLAAYLGSVYTSAFKTKVLFYSTLTGAFVNIILNILFIPIYGAYAAASTTLVSYFVIWIFRLINSKKYIVIRYNVMSTIIQIFILTTMAFTPLLFLGTTKNLILLCGMLILIVINYKFLRVILKFILSKIQYKVRKTT